MDLEVDIKRLLADPQTVPSMTTSEFTQWVDQLKQEADRHWWIDCNRSLVFADLIVALGQCRNDRCAVALGVMARGDALKMLGRIEEAWDALELSGQLYE